MPGVWHFGTSGRMRATLQLGRCQIERHVLPPRAMLTYGPRLVLGGDYVCIHCLTETGVCVDFHSPYHHQREQKCPSFGLSSVPKVSSGSTLLEAISGSMAPPQSGSVSTPLILATTKGRTDAQSLL